MKEKIIEQKRILKLRCYKWEKFYRVDERKAACPWGYTEINENCKNCRWFDIQKVGLNGAPIVTDREVTASEVPQLAREYAQFPQVIDVQSAEDAIKAEEEPGRGIH